MADLLFCNFANDSYVLRNEIFEGRPQLVVPVVLIKEGVLNGSAGPLFYSADELAKFNAAWNGVPVPINHPANGCGTPSVVEKCVGRVWNVFFDEKKNALVGEIWFDEQKLKQNAALYDRILAKQPIEVSTGLFADDIPEEGVYNGVAYIGRASNIRPDHLAILPSATGACSLSDGCGIRKNQKADSNENSSQGDVSAEQSASGSTEKGVSNMDDNKTCGCAETIQKLLANASLGFTAEDSEKLKTVDNSILAKLLTHAEALEAAKAETKENEEETENKCSGTKKKKEEAQMNAEALEAAKAETNLDELLANASPELRESIQAGVALHKKNKDAKIQSIMSNSRNTFSKARLESMSLEELEAISALATPVASYEGRAVGNASASAVEALPVPGFVSNTKKENK